MSKTTIETEEEKKKREEKERQQELFNAYRNAFAREGIERLMRIERCSPLSIEDFFRAILKIATNEPMLRAALEHNTITTGKPDPTLPSPTIVTELP